MAVIGYWPGTFWGKNFWPASFWPGGEGGAPPIIYTYPYYLYPGDMTPGRIVKIKPFRLKTRK